MLRIPSRPALGWPLRGADGTAARLSRFIRRFAAGADRQRALASYRNLAPDYDASTSRIEKIQRAAIDALHLRSGDQVLDVACGTGKTLTMLAEQVGAEGRVVGVEQCPEMVRIARRRVRHLAQVKLVQSPVEGFESPLRFDAVLLSFTQDVLQQPAAVEQVLACCHPEARLAVAGLRFLPWWWGWTAPVNCYNAYRARHYLTTYDNLQAPWRSLQHACPDLAVRQAWYLGSCYLAVGRIGAGSPSRASSRPLDE